MLSDGVYADLHTHTNCSDGTDAPAALVKRAAERGIQVLSVTDHDTVDGIGAAMQEARTQQLHVLTGTELSVTQGKEELHLLAYGFDPSDRDLQRHLETMQEARRERVWTIVERLRQRGIEAEDERLRSDIASTHAVGRPHVAAALVRTGHVETHQSAFEKYLGKDRPGFVAKPAFPASDALSMIHNAGGIGVLAHPGHWTSSTQVRRLVEAGLDGLEVIHPSHDSSLQGYYERVARGYDLIPTGGSDYHGRTDADEKHFGKVGMSRPQWERFWEVIS